MSSDTISGPLSVMLSTGTVVVSSNSVSGPAVVEDNTGPLAPIVSANTGAVGPSSAPPTHPLRATPGRLNKASGGAQGQCASLA